MKNMIIITIDPNSLPGKIYFLNEGKISKKTSPKNQITPKINGCMF
jgi:hypothetical protein